MGCTSSIEASNTPNEGPRKILKSGMRYIGPSWIKDNAYDRFYPTFDVLDPF